MGRGHIAGLGYRWTVLCAGVALAALFWPSQPASGARCEQALDRQDIRSMLAEIERSIDPCGESAEILHVVAQFRRCAASGVRICTDHHSERNFIERASAAEGHPSTIIWNPVLRSQLETGCGGDPERPVLRDPTASLLPELVHAVQDCQGLDPAEHEFEAVRIENIYRRAHGLCQRTRYGEERLPVHMLVGCEPGQCLCTGRDTRLLTASAPSQAGGQAAGDTAPRSAP